MYYKIFLLEITTIHVTILNTLFKMSDMGPFAVPLEEKTAAQNDQQVLFCISILFLHQTTVLAARKLYFCLIWT